MGEIWTEAIKVTLKTSCWMGRVNDTERASALADEVGADDDVFVVVKRLMPKAERLRSLHNLRAKARRTHRAMTLAWDDNGGRLLPIKNFFEYGNAMRPIIQTFNAEADAFASEYGDLRSEALRALGA